MDGMNVIMWMIGGAFTILFGILLCMWHFLIQKLNHVEGKIDKLDEKVTDIDRRLCRLEGAFSAKECCVIKDERHLTKAE